ncbi:MAG TPA: HAMP domain-containing sensor histidine kinase [Pyrinomonadaceae bacterium]|nr:HAMP domain-containing sensor histidine kinase [Pyrinomonadaceae bacterium]
MVSSLLILLGVLAFFQYKWVGQISESEQERLQKRLDLDAQHFADDFNRILQNTYFSFQSNGENWANNFLDRYQLWQQNSPYPKLIKDFYVIQPNGEMSRFDTKTKQFTPIAASDRFLVLQNNFEPVDEKNLTLTMPVYDQPNRFTATRHPFDAMEAQSPIPPSILQMPNVLAYLVIQLDEGVIKDRIINDLTAKYFPEGDYKLSVFSKRQNTAIFQTENLPNSDASVPIFELMPENLAFFVNKDLWTTLNNSGEKKQIILNQRVENRISTTAPIQNGQLKIQVFNGNNNQIFERKALNSNALWALNVRHNAGSLEQFVASSRRKNLLISFGILGLLGGSIGLIFLSARRAQMLAQRQLDFVSAVSHEFRTPIAVIYSAAENLADGVAREGTQVSRYGNLIKGEGKKLGAMVEQILEFAGARSGHKKYDFRQTDVKTVIEGALNDCQPLIAEKDFTVETEIYEDLPVIQADSNALSHAIQNLIINGIKYSNGSNWLKISAKNGGGTIKIAVEDRGIGISKKDLKQIFSPFYRAKSVVDAQIHGNGLGLSLVKQTIDAHHGKIEVESELGKGSKFVIELPQT